MGWLLGRSLNDVVPFVSDIVRAASIKQFDIKKLSIEHLYDITYIFFSKLIKERKGEGDRDRNTSVENH